MRRSKRNQQRLAAFRRYSPPGLWPALTLIAAVIFASSFYISSSLRTSKTLIESIKTDDIPGLISYVELSAKINELLDLPNVWGGDIGAYERQTRRSIAQARTIIDSLEELERDRQQDRQAVSQIRNSLFEYKRCKRDVFAANQALSSDKYMVAILKCNERLKADVLPLLNVGAQSEKWDTFRALDDLFENISHSYIANIATSIVITLVFLFLISFAFIRLWAGKHSLHSRLRVALKEHQFVNFYQPLVNTQTGKVKGVEVLTRWYASEYEMVLPDVFIKELERAGLIDELAKHQLDQAIEDLQQIMADDPHFEVSINFSAKQLANSELCDFIAQKRPAFNRLIVEITEQTLVDLSQAIPHVECLKEAGVEIAIDDFGTGYSSLQYLQTLPLDIIKIDRVFVNSINQQAVNSSVLNSIIELAHQLQKTVIAEGVEDEEQAQYLIEKGVYIHQGWLYAKALELDELIQFLE